MSTWEVPCLIVVAGGVGGMINAGMSQNGFVLPKASATADGTKIWRPGILGNVVASAVAALVSWGLYGSGATVDVFRGSPTDRPSLTYSALVGAILVGIGGARWLTSEVDKNLLRAAAVAAATKSNDNGDLAIQLAGATPIAAFSAATNKP